MEASVATRSKMSLTKELRIDMARLEIPVSGWTCLRTGEENASVYASWIGKAKQKSRIRLDQVMRWIQVKKRKRKDATGLC